MKYNGLKFSWEDSAFEGEILIAFIADLGFESFEEKEKELIAYIQRDSFIQDDLDEILNQLDVKISYKIEEIKDQNWNKVWESNYDSVIISDQCYIRAPFHEHNRGFKYEIEIEPQMSFGTAHHETTAMILEYILENEFKEESVLDMGCGTAVLAILAALKGAKTIMAIDNDEWAYRNSLENVKRNKFPEIKVIQGDAKDLIGKSFDTIFANINRNILLSDMDSYVKSMNSNGRIFFSGFYLEDLPLIQKKAESLNLNYQDYKQKGKWIAAYFKLN